MSGFHQTASDYLRIRTFAWVERGGAVRGNPWYPSNVLEKRKIRRLGVLGLGAMGGAVAVRLIESGLAETVVVMDSDPAAVARAVAAGGTARAQGEFDALDVLVSSLPDDDACRSALLDRERLSALAGGTLIELSTVLPTTMREIADVATSAGVSVIDSPVSGGPAEALTGELVLMVGAQHVALEKARPVLEALGVVEHVGLPGDGKTLKLISNAIGMTNMVAAAEGFALGRSLGLDADVMYRVLSRSGARSHHLQSRIPRAMVGDYEPRFALRLGAKDLRLALNLAEGAGLTLSAVSAVRDVVESAVADGLGGQDIVAVFKVYDRLPS